jgi:predicted DNA-binding helix-hairpin-helix protein
MRRCGFEADELTTPEQPDLELDIEPKLAWALRHRHATFAGGITACPRVPIARSRSRL